MVLPLSVARNLRHFSVGMLINDWILLKDKETIQLHRTRVYTGIALMAIGLFVLWEKKKEKESTSSPTFVALLGAFIAADGWKNIQRVYRNVLRSSR